MNYVYHLLIMICLYGMLAQSLNLVVGFAGLLSLGHAAFYGLGAYLATLLMMNAGWPFILSLVAAVVFVGALAWLVAIPATRLQGDFFVLYTLGFQMIVFSTLYNWVDVTRGPFGIPGVPRPVLFGATISTPAAFCILSLVVALVVCGALWLLASSPYGRALQAVREDAVAAASLGKDTDAFKRSAFAWAGALAAIPGVLFASYSSYIDPTSFGLEESIFILCVLVIGGAGNLRGPLIGAVVLVLLPELLRFVRIPDSAAANVRQIIYGLALILMMRFRPQGIAGKYAFD